MNGQTAPPPVQRGSTTPMSMRLLEACDLEQYREAWQDLANFATAPNPFYEPWTLLPAIAHLADKAELRFLLVFGPPGQNGAEPPLRGFFPLEVRSQCLRLPIRTLAFWQHRHCFLSVPLIHAEHVREVLDTFWRWFERNPLGCHVLDTNYLLVEGGFHESWSDFAIGRSAHTLMEYPRALELLTGTYDAYVNSITSAHRRNENRRKERRLRELGSLDYRHAASAADADAWVDEFLKLEARGWKGGAGGAAIAKQPAEAAYFRSILTAGFLEDRVSLVALLLDGKPIAMKSVFQSGAGGFVFKSSYDEGYSRYSPGMLLELGRIRQLFAAGRVPWVDSCAVARHPLYEMIANKRRIIRRTLFSDGSTMGDFWISILPLLRWLHKRMKRQPPPDYLQISTRIRT
jgi:CelD/BcsL family acetyltransferase involved in cellulose biosynthesis